MTGGLSKEHRISKSPPTGSLEKVKRRHHLSDQLPESFSLTSILAEQGCTTMKDSESEWLAKDNWETNPITIKPKTASHVTELFSWVPLTYCSPLGCPFPIKSRFVSTCVSLDNSILSVRQEPSFGPWKMSPFLQQSHEISNLLMFVYTLYIWDISTSKKHH